jgi:hypothetical protein
MESLRIILERLNKEKSIILHKEDVRPEFITLLSNSVLCFSETETTLELKTDELVIHQVIIGESYKKKFESIILSIDKFVEGFEGYRLIRTTKPTSNRPPTWEKLPALLSLLENNKFVIQVDADFLAMFSVPPEYFLSLLPKNKSFLVGIDENANKNLGIFLLKADQDLKKFIQKMWDATRFVHSVWEENSAFIHFYDKDIRSLCKVLPQKFCQLIQADPREYKGSPFVHFGNLPWREKHSPNILSCWTSLVKESSSDQAWELLELYSTFSEQQLDALPIIKMKKEK